MSDCVDLSMNIRAWRTRAWRQFSWQEHEWIANPFSGVIFPTQGSNPGLLHCRQILYRLSHQGSLLRESYNQTVTLPSITFLFLLPFCLQKSSILHSSSRLLSICYIGCCPIHTDFCSHKLLKMLIHLNFSFNRFCCDKLPFF